MNKILFNSIFYLLPLLSSPAFCQQENNCIWLDQFNEPFPKNAFGQDWYTYNDQSNGGASTIDWNHNKGPDKVLGVSYQLEKNNLKWQPNVTIGTSVSSSQLDLSIVQGIRYKYKGAAHSLIYKTSNVKDYCFFQKDLSASEDWTTIILILSDFSQPSWGQKVPFSAASLSALEWQIKGNSGNKGILFIDDVCFLTEVNYSLLTIDQKVDHLNYTFPKGDTKTTVSYSKRLSIQEQKTELGLLKEKLEYHHPSLYRFSSQIEINKLFSTLEKNITKERTVHEFHQFILPVFLAIRDAHTHCQLPKDSAKATLLFPLDVKIISNRLYIYQNFTDRTEIKNGAEILSINGIKSSEILTNLKKSIVVDGYIETTRERILEGWFCFFYPSIYGNPTVFQLETKYEGKLQQIKDLQALSESVIEKEQKKEHRKPAVLATPSYSFNVIEEKKAAILKIVYFEAIEEKEYYAFIDSCFDEIKNKHLTNLIIDLRWNIGGPRKYAIYLYSKLSTHPFNYLKEQVVTFPTLKKLILNDSTLTYEQTNNNLFRIISSNDIGMGLQQPASQPFTGKVFLLIDGQSNSSSSHFASTFHHNHRGVIVGEESGCVYNGFASGYYNIFDLPYSNLKVQIPLVLNLLNVNNTLFPGHGVPPDHPFNPTNIQNIIDGKDEVLEYTIDLIK